MRPEGDRFLGPLAARIAETRAVSWGLCDSRHSPGLLRQYLPKSADLRQLDQATLDAIAAELNGRPRQILGFKTPSQALTMLVR